MTDFSPILLNQARSTTPLAIANPLLVFIVVVLALRIWTVRSGRPSLLLNALLAVATTVVLLRHPPVQEVLFGLGMNLATVRVICHTVVMFGAAIAWLLARSWRTSRKFGRLELTLVFGCATALSAWLWWVSSSARAQNAAVEDFESWRTAAYLVVVSTPVPIACVAIVLALVAHAKERNEVSNWIWASASILAAVLQATDHITRGISGVFLSLGRHNLLTDIRTEGVDQIFLPAVAALSLSALPAIWSTIHSDAGLKAVDRDIHLMWSNIKSRIPGIAKPETGSLPLRERVEEMYIEIEDGLIRLSLPPSFSSYAEAAQQIRDSLAADGGEQWEISSPHWVADRTEIRKVAAAFRELTDERVTLQSVI